MRLIIYKTLMFLFIMMMFAYLVLGSRIVHFKKYTEFETRPLFTENIRTGDIFLLSYQHPIKSLFADGFMGVRFIHPSVAVWEEKEKNGKIEKELYIVEYAIYKNYKDVIKVPFHEWLRINSNTLILHSPLIYEGDEKELSSRILSIYEKYKDFETVPTLDLIRFMIINNGKYQKRSHKKDIMACTEFIALLFIEIGALNKYKRLENYEPEDFIGMQGFDLKEEYFYMRGYLCDRSQYPY